jgi:hypothetical protein
LSDLGTVENAVRDFDDRQARRAYQKDEEQRG